MEFNKIIKKNMAINIFILFDLSPVNKIAADVNKRNIKGTTLLILGLSIKNPKIIKINPDKKAPATGSSLKKLTILSECACGTPLISDAPQPKRLDPEKNSKNTSNEKNNIINPQK